MKDISQGVYLPCAQDFKKLLNASPYLQDLWFEFIRPGQCIVHASVIHEVLEHISSSPPIPVGDVPGFLPNLQSLTIIASEISPPTWESISRLFSWPHRKLLRLYVEVYYEIKMGDDTLHTILRLVDEGIDICILEGSDYVDYLQKSKENLRKADPSEGSFRPSVGG